MSEAKRWWIVVLFGTAMAWMESATVAYLRLLVGRVNPYQAAPLPPHPLLGATELVREIATMVMLFAVGWLAGRDWRSRLSYSLIAFGVWDILYYVFLAVIVGWPKSIFDWDVLFLIPLPWWGPVIAPVIIALLMIAGGTMVTQFPGRPWPRRSSIMVGLIGIAVALVVFMQPAIRALPGGEEALRNALPANFNWPWFAVGCTMMSATIADLLVQRKTRAKVAVGKTVSQ
ncbi:MAG: hypothetical protein ACRD3E_10530 [Terriglobales bacterium]